jgi:uncharacterized damage-inducible protein DinB
VNWRNNLTYIFKANRDTTKRLLDDISNDESIDSAGGLCNPIIWQTGHLAWCADIVVWLLGGNKTLPREWVDIFEYGSKLPEDNTEHPPFTEVRNKLYEIQQNINDLLKNVDETTFNDEVELLKDWRMNRLDALLFFAKHDYYHIGQITILRRKLGREAPFG